MELAVFFLGVLSSVLGYFIANFFLAPIVRYKDCLTSIGSRLKYYSHIITSPGAGRLADEASPIIRELAIDLEQKYLRIPLRSLLSFLYFLPTKKQLYIVKGEMIFLSNSVHDDGRTSENQESLKRIFTGLNIEELEKRYNTR